jgi:hypothetical protein
MSTEDLLCKEQSTTSLYETVTHSNKSYVLALNQASVKYCTTTPENTKRKDEPDYTEEYDAPQIVVQLRKRGGKIDLFIDGYVSNPKATDDGVIRHVLYSHTGLHEDAVSGNRVFSPIAIVAAIEDGQHALQGVTVSVAHNYANRGSLLEPTTVLSEGRIQTHRVSDVRCGVLRVPYPLSFPAPPTVAMYDDTQRREHDARLLGQFDYMNRVGLVFTAATTAKLVTVGSLSWSQGLVGLTAALVGQVASAAAATKLYAAGWKFVGLAMLESLKLGVGFWADKTNVLMAETDRLVRLIVPLKNILTSAMQTYVRIKEAPQFRRTEYTLPDLVRTIESICILRAPSDSANPDQVNDDLFVNTDAYKKEKAVWNFLICDTKQDGLNAEMASIDLEKLIASAHNTSNLHIRIDVDDSLGCNNNSNHHELHCGREDKELLAAASGGTLDDLSRLFKAVSKLRHLLEDAIEEKSDAKNGLRNIGMWVDRDYFNPLRYISYIATQAKLWEKYKKTKVEGAQARYKKYVSDGWVAATTSDPCLTTRPELLKLALKNLTDKIYNPLFLPDSPGMKLYTDLQSALGKRGTIVTTDPEVMCIRRLPQRADASQARLLFSAVRDRDIDYADVWSGTLPSRRYSEYRDASTWLSTIMQSSRMALRRFVPEWESNSTTRVTMLCMCSSFDTSHPPHVPSIAYSTLSLTTPIDILVASVLASPTERAQRRMRLIVKRSQSALGKSAHKTILETLGLEHTDAFLMACHVFGDVWSDELVSLHGATNSRQVEILESASVRASVRLRAAGAHLLALVSDTRPPSEAITHSDVALNSTDIAFVATQAGRDAGLIVSRILFRYNLIAARTVMVYAIQDVARAAVRTAAVFALRVPVNLPHEACASLFGNPLDGVAAFLRVRKLSTNPVILATVAAAYPSVRLLDKDETFTSEHATNTLAQSVPQPPMSMTTGTQQLVRAMRFRLASLRVDVDVDVDVDVVGNGADSSGSTTVDELAMRLSSTSVGNTKPISFYVPFGFGDARPPPTRRQCAAPLFGSVPVYGSALVEAFQSISDMGGSGAKESTARSFAIRLEPTFDCLKPPRSDNDKEKDIDDEESVHPNVVQVLRYDDQVVVRYSASCTPPHVATPQDTVTLVDETITESASAARAADSHFCSKEASSIALQVSSMAWNAERVVQAVVAALASADEQVGYESVSLTLVLPASDTRVTHWYTTPTNPIATAQRTHNHQQTLLIHKIFIDALLFEVTKRVQFAVQFANADEVAKELLSTLAGTALMKAVVESLEQTELDPGALLKRRHERIHALLNPQFINSIQEKYGVKEDLDNQDSDAAERQVYTDKHDAYFQPFLDAIEELKTLRLSKHKTDMDEILSKSKLPVRTPTTVKETGRALVAALGVGMALLAPQVEHLKIKCHAIVQVDNLVPHIEEYAQTLASTFSKCDAVRLGEACLVSSQVV